MTYDATDDRLRTSLLASGFNQYPTHSNKFYDKEGHIVWTDGEWVKDSSSAFIKESGLGWHLFNPSEDQS